jgi:hypothetical protein
VAAKLGTEGGIAAFWAAFRAAKMAFYFAGRFGSLGGKDATSLYFVFR